MYSQQGGHSAALFIWAALMLKEIAEVRDEVVSRCGEKGDLETITKVFTELTIVDHIVFVRCDIPETNPIVGAFQRWSRSPAVYHGSETIVEIRYAEHLLRNTPMRRFVVCKELCHSLEIADGVCDISPTAMANLVTSFALMSAGSLGSISPTMQSELLAYTGAVELLCPLAERERVVEDLGRTPNHAEITDIAAKFEIPAPFLLASFQPSLMKAMDELFTNGR